ncbi:uncharacterized protein DS421_6g172300 [Arachis hypogaea]|nr:uncharacterized protein DS421_6g172300 [Arachis hypogaea]
MVIHDVMMDTEEAAAEESKSMESYFPCSSSFSNFKTFLIGEFLMVLWHGVCCREAEERSRDTAGRSERCILESTTMDMQFGAAEMILKAIDATEDKSQLQRRKRPATVLVR